MPVVNHAGHECEVLILAPVLALGAWAIVGADLAWLFACGLVFGTVWLSPDLDHHVGSASARRWWLLRCIWAPYAMMIPHRSVLSHGPVIGTAGRLLWLAIAFSPAIVALMLGGIVIARDVWGWYAAHEYEAWAVLAGLEASAMVHATADWMIP